MVYFDGMSRKQILRKLKHYNSADKTYYMRDPSHEFDWCIPKKFYNECKREGARLPEGMPYPAPLAKPERLDLHGIEPGTHSSSSSRNFTRILKRSIGGHRWYEHETHILWNKYRVLRGKLDRNHRAEKNRITRVQKWQIHSYDLRANKWQVLSKMHRIGQLDKDWRACDYYISKAISTTIKKNGHFPRHRMHNLPGSSSVLKYLRRNHTRRSKPDENLRHALDCLFIAARAAGLDKRSRRDGGLADHMPHEWLHDIYQEAARDAGRHRGNRHLSGRELRAKGGDGCAFHCHKKRLSSDCKRKELKKYAGSSRGPRHHHHEHHHHHRRPHHHHYDDVYSTY